MKKTWRAMLSLLLALALLAGVPVVGAPLAAEAEESTYIEEPWNLDPPEFAEQTEDNNLIGSSVFGYQMWFEAKETGGWKHWNVGPAGTAPGRPHCDMWPYVQDYIDNGATLYETNLGNLGDGTPSLLFNSHDEAIVETHFQWLDEYDLDAMAIQRFGLGFDYEVKDEDNHLITAQRMAEKYNKSFYVMYDLSGQGKRAEDYLYKRVARDFVVNVEMQGVASSTAYAHADGKPVICLWGISGNEADTNYVRGQAAVNLIQWFQDRGYYVVVGTPDNGFTTREGVYLQPFLMADMISPWSVGRYSYTDFNNFLKNSATRDNNFCKEHDIAYQPVLFPGFSWVNMQNAGKPNAFPRRQGTFIWSQAVGYKSLDVDSFYFAMFDEYDEGTAWMKGASDSFDIPEGHFFLTYAVDGQWLSNDYYLRVAREVVRYLKDETDAKALNIPYSEGPVYFRNSFEKRWVTWVDTNSEGGMQEGTNQYWALADLDVGVRLNAFNKKANVTLETKTYEGKTEFLVTDKTQNKDTYGTNRTGTGVFRDVERKYTRSGEWALQVQGTATADEADLKYLIDATKIQVPAGGLELSYGLYAVNEGGCRVSVDLAMASGHMLSLQVPQLKETGAKVGEWVDVTIPLPTSLVGEQISYIVISYEGGAGEFNAYIDDIVLQTAGTEKEMLTAAVNTALELKNDSDDFMKALGAAQALLANNDATAKQYLAAMKTLDNVLRTEGVQKMTLGDANGDGKVNTADAALVLQFAAELLDETGIQTDAADVNGDGKVTTADAALMLQFAAELIETFPAA